MSIAAQLQRTVRNAGAQAMAAAVQTVVSSLDDGVPVDRGTLKRSRRVSGIRPTAAGFSVDIAYTAPQAEFTEKGTRPHVIRPRRAKALRFVSGGRTVFARVVHHPGTKAQHWFSRRVNLARWSSALRGGFR